MKTYEIVVAILIVILFAPATAWGHHAPVFWDFEGRFVGTSQWERIFGPFAHKADCQAYWATHMSTGMKIRYAEFRCQAYVVR